MQIETHEVYVTWMDLKPNASIFACLSLLELETLKRTLNRYLGNRAHVLDIGQQPFRTLFLTVEAIAAYKRETIIHDILKTFQKTDGYVLSKNRTIRLLSTGDGGQYKYVSVVANHVKLELQWSASIIYDKDIEKQLTELDKLAKDWFIPLLYYTNEILVNGVRIADVEVGRNKLVLYLLVDAPKTMEAVAKFKKELTEDGYNALTIDPDTNKEEQILIMLG